MSTIIGLLRDLFLVDLFGQLLGGLIRLALVILFVVGALWVVCEFTNYSFTLPLIGNVCTLVCRIPFVPCPEQPPPPAEVDCPQFAKAFPQLLPDTWQLLHVQSINIDGDSEKECLAVYQYNAGNGPYGGPLGGVVYDPQPDRDPQNMETPVPYRPAAYVPYHLLPREDGKGFLSERAGDWSQMIQVYDADGDTYDELVFRGYSGYGFPTYVSIFEWVNKQQGYRLMTTPVAGETVGGPLWGDAGVDIKRETRTDEEGNETESGPIERVTIKTRPAQPFWYFRSQLCYATIYRWNDARTSLVQEDYYLTFCFGRPNSVPSRQDEYFLWYPEEALLAWYEDGEVRDISIPPHPAGNTLEATVTLRQGSQQRWLATWKLRENTDDKVANMTFWYLEMVGDPVDP